MTAIVLSVVGKVSEVKTLSLQKRDDSLDRWAIRITYENAHDIVFTGTEEELGPLAKLLDKSTESLDDA